MFLLRDKLIMQGEKRETSIDPNLQPNNVARQVEGFCISYFAGFSNVKFDAKIEASSLLKSLQ